MKIRSNAVTWVLSGSIAATALASMLAAGTLVRRDAARASHQQPLAETWVLPETLTSPALVTRGRTLFLDSCARCHAADATGDEGPDLHNVQVSDRYIARIILHGIPHEMPSFIKKHDAADIAALTAYVRTLD